MKEALDLMGLTLLRLEALIRSSDVPAETVLAEYLVHRAKRAGCQTEFHLLMARVFQQLTAYVKMSSAENLNDMVRYHASRKMQR